MGTNIKDKILKSKNFKIDGEEGYYIQKIGKAYLLYKKISSFDTSYRGSVDFFEIDFGVTSFVGNKEISTYITYKEIEL